MHSVLICAPIERSLQTSFPQLKRYYRLFYNLFSLLTLLPLIILTKTDVGEPILSWNGTMTLGRVILIFLSCLLFYGGARRYDLFYFLGIKQMRSGKESLLLSEDQSFSPTGVFGITRHPWYLGSLLLLWSILPEYDEKMVLVALILSVYLWLGTLLEERKILAQYGESYREYTTTVSRFVPWKWLLTKFARNG